MKVYLLQQMYCDGPCISEFETLGIFKDKLFMDAFLNNLLTEYFRYEIKIEESIIRYDLFKENGWAYETWFEITEMELI